MSRFAGPQRRGAGRLYRIRRAARVADRQLAAIARNHTNTTDPEQDCE